MNGELISSLIGTSFGIFLTIQYVIFFFALSKKKEVKKSRKDLAYIIFIGLCIILSGFFEVASLHFTSQDLYPIFNKMKIVFGVVILMLYILLIRHILVSIKDQNFVETDEFKNKSKRYITIFIIASVFIELMVILTNIKFLDTSFAHILLLVLLVIYLIFAGTIEYAEFRKIIKNEIGKISQINMTRYNSILASGMIGILLVIVEIVLILIFGRSITLKTGSFYMYGLDFLAIGLSLNLVFEYMEALTRVNETNKKLSELNRQMMDDVRTAQSLQISLLPLDKQKIIQGFIDMEISYMPMQSVGGDYYDFYNLDNNRVLLFLGDASGHGVYAAMIWAILKVEVEELIEDKQFNNLSQAFTILNQRITRILENTYSYATLFACLIDLNEKTASYISAGHTDQLYFSAKDQLVSRIRNKNPIIGTFKNVKFKADSINYQTGDAILMFSDGIVEGANPEGEQLGKERLEQIFLDAAKTETGASPMISHLLIHLEDYFEGTMQKDDKTLMVIKL